jgi:hypothetical protein
MMSRRSYSKLCAARPFEIVRMQYVEGISRRLYLLTKGA